jgi:TRAP-type C4-dicarboxylate transport system substrate-binding protein
LKIKQLKSLAAVTIATTLSLGQVSAEEITLRFQHFVSPKSAVPAGFMTPWAEKIMEESEGRLKIEIYPGMQLGGKPPALYDQIRDGVIDGGWAIPSYTPGRFPEAEAFELPFMTSLSAEASSRAAWEFTQKYLTERMSDVHLIAVHVHGPGVIHKKGEPIEQVSDFEGLKLRGPSRQANKLLESLGASAIGMPVPAFPENLSKGVVDGGVIPWEIVKPLKVHELADSHTVIGGDRSLYNTYFIWAMNKDSYAKLPDDLKAIIDSNSGLDASGWAGRAMEEGDAVGLEATEAQGNTIATMDDAVVAEIKSISEELIGAWVAEMDEKGLPGQAMVDDAKALVEAQSQ